MSQVSFNERVKCMRSPSFNYTKHSSNQWKDDIRKNKEKSSKLGAKQLAERSLVRAEEKCACFEPNQCQSGFHDHENFMYGIHCGNTKSKKCSQCSKQICEICMDEHVKKHNQIKCECSTHPSEKIVTKTNQCDFCPKKICEYCEITHKLKHQSKKIKCECSSHPNEKMITKIIQCELCTKKICDHCENVHKKRHQEKKKVACVCNECENPKHDHATKKGNASCENASLFNIKGKLFCELCVSQV